MRTSILTLAAAAIVATACGSSTSPQSKIVNLTATLTPGNEPAVTGNPTGSGTFTATLDTSTNVFTWNMQFSGLLANAVAGHIHGPFTPGGSSSGAGVILNFSPASFPGSTFTGLGTATSGSATGSIVLSAATQVNAAVNGDSLKKLLLAGLTYVNVHTSTNQGGEIRGQITKQ